MNPAGGRVSARLFPAGRPERVVALIGNPNVGKSTLFNHVTGQDVFTAHYPGKTPDVNVGTTHVGDTELSIVDLPGVYSIDGTGAEALVARSTLLDVGPDVCVIVLDSTNLTRNLVLALQVLDLGIPSVIALNLCDEAGRCGLAVDSDLLGALLGADVVQTVATQGMGLAEVMDRAVTRLETPGGELPRHRYGDVFERALSPLVHTLARESDLPYGLSPRSTALELIEDPVDVESAFPQARAAGLSRVAEEARASLAVLTGEEPRTALARERHGAAGVIAGRCTGSTYSKLTLQDRLLSYTTRARTGVPLLILILLTIFGLLFVVGGFLAEIFSSLWATFGSPLIQSIVERLFGDGPLATTLLWGLDAGIEASLGIGLPYILTFYFMLSLLEDTGYLNSVAFLADRAMHNVGLHGRAVIPLVAGAGCSVPAVLSVRVLPSDRERFIAATLVSFVPCSARTAVILGAAGAFIGWLPALGVYLVTLAVAWTVGLSMDRLIPGSSPGFVMEMFPFRRPRFRIVGRKAWSQFTGVPLRRDPVGRDREHGPRRAV